MIKKFLAAATLSAAVLAASACGSSGTTTAETSSDATTTATADELTTPTVIADTTPTAADYTSTDQTASDDTSSAASGTDSTAAGASGGDTTAAGEFNDADVTFAQSMIPHHEQAVEMAKLAPERSQNPEILDLAKRIQDAQDPEIEQMRSWLAAWGQEEPPAMDHGDMDHGDMEGMEGMDHSMDGMMTSEDMTALENASGPEFDKMWVDLMIKHHEGAITMSQTEIADGASPEAKQMAEQIIVAQTAEITEMQNLNLG